MAGRTPTTNQIEFIDLIVDHITEQGAMDPRRLYESPFTDIDDQGLGGVFFLEDSKALIVTLRDIQARASA